jgi:hypothetical protein
VIPHTYTKVVHLLPFHTENMFRCVIIPLSSVFILHVKVSEDFRPTKHNNIRRVFKTPHPLMTSLEQEKKEILNIRQNASKA